MIRWETGIWRVVARYINILFLFSVIDYDLCFYIFTFNSIKCMAVTMDYLKEIESIIFYLEKVSPEMATRLRKNYQYSVTSSELLLKCMHFLLEMQSDVSEEMRNKIGELEIYCNSIGLFPSRM